MVFMSFNLELLWDRVWDDSIKELDVGMMLSEKVCSILFGRGSQSKQISNISCSYEYTLHLNSILLGNFHGA
jgi:hypothetical protein